MVRRRRRRARTEIGASSCDLDMDGGKLIRVWMLQDLWSLYQQEKSQSEAVVCC